MSYFVVDTSVLIDYLRGFGESQGIMERVKNGEIQAGISTLTQTELFSGKGSEVEQTRRKIENVLEFFVKINVDEQVAIKAGEFRRRYDVGIPDAIIAATAFISNAKLLTCDRSDFGKIKEIEAEKPY